ncbi:MAG: ROK family protein [Sphaerochaeta sp.]
MKIVGNSQYQKEANALLILNLLRRYMSSRVQIAHELGLQNSTVTYNVARLMENGSVIDVESNGTVPENHGKIGRKPNLISLNPEFGRVVGIEMMSSLYRMYISDITGFQVFKAELPYTTKEGPKNRNQFEKLVEEVIEKAVSLCESVPLLGVCIAVPAIVLEGNTCIQECWTHGLDQVQFSGFLEKFPFPVIFENDANCCAVKYLFNNDDQNDCYFYLLSRKHKSEDVPEGIPTIGLGLGVVIKGELYRGSFSRSGEYRSSALMGTESNAQSDVDFSDLLKMDEDAGVRENLIQHLFSDLFCSISIFDPRSLYVGGFLASSPYKETIADLLETTLKDSWFQNKWEGELILVHDTLFDPAEGAADLILDHLYRVPQVGSTEPDQRKWNALLQGII